MKIKNLKDTIAAPATVSGNAPIAIIRCSGCNAKAIIEKIFNKKMKPREMCFGKLYGEGEYIDEVQYVFYEKEKSYTGEDSFEIFSHGNPIIVRKILNLIIKKGARFSEPGEFTKRAYLNNKMSLAKAEAVESIINAENELALSLAQRNHSGQLEAKLEATRDYVIMLLEKLEIEIDFNDQDIEVYNAEQASSLLMKLETELEELIKNFENIKKLIKSTSIAVWGAVNVGKSTIFNKILGYKRAITSKKPGTTRDIISEELCINDRNYKILDMAGYRKTEEEVEKEGIENAHMSIQNADIILYVVDAKREETWDVYKEVNEFPIKNTILIINKRDLLGNNNIKGFKKFNQKILYSAINDDIDIVKNKIYRKLKKEVQIENAIFVNERQYFLLKEAKKYIANAKNVIDTPDLLSYEIKNICECIENLIGKVENEKILDNIFSKFCVGK